MFGCCCSSDTKYEIVQDTAPVPVLQKKQISPSTSTTQKMQQLTDTCFPQLLSSPATVTYGTGLDVPLAGKQTVGLSDKKMTQELPIEPPTPQPIQDVESYYYKCLTKAKKENCLDEQISYLEKLSELYVAKKQVLVAAKILNSALALLKNNPSLEKTLLAKLEHLEDHFLQSQGIKKAATRKNYLGTYRAQLKSRHEQCIKALARNEPICTIHADLTKAAKKLLATLITHVQSTIGPPPVQWAAIGMGSMARGEMCPYSDVEFGFLISENTPEALDYFRTLSRCLQLSFINLGETPFPIFGHAEPSPTPTGFCLDTGGNTPLGMEGWYELIGTPDYFAQFQTTKWMNENIILTNTLNCVCLIAGNEKLFLQYEKVKDQVAQTPVQINSHKKAINQSSLPKEGAIVQEQFCKIFALHLLRGHLFEFEPNLSSKKEETKEFVIKKELYRPLQEVFNSLALFYNLKEKTSRGKVDALVKLGVFSKKGGENLKKALEEVIALRLQAHLFYQTEQEFLIQIEQGQPLDSTKLYLDETMLQKLQAIYRVILPFHKCAKEFAKSQKKEAFCQSSFYDDSFLTQGEAYAKILQYKKAEELFQQAISLNPNDLEALVMFGHMRQSQGDAQEALVRAQHALKVAQEKFGETDPNVLISLNSIGSALKLLGKADKALVYYKRSLKVCRQLHGEFNELNPDTAICLHSIGGTLQALGKTDKALKYYSKALKIQQNLYGNIHLDIAMSLHSIGETLHTLGRDYEAIEYYTRALKVWRLLFSETHPGIATSLSGIGAVFIRVGRIDEGIEHFKQALMIVSQIYGEIHPDVATGLNNIGATFKTPDTLDEALKYCTDALKIRRKIYGEIHPDIAFSLNNIGDILKDKKEYAEALKYHAEALQMRRKIYGEIHPDIAFSLNNMAIVFQTMGKADEALPLHTEALKMRRQLYDELHPAVAVSLNNSGSALYALGKIEEALDYYKQALKIQRQLYGGDHPEVRGTLSNMIVALKALRGAEQTFKAFEYRSQASSLKDTGNFHLALGLYIQAHEILEQSFGATHHDVATNLNDMGDTLHTLGEIESAFPFYNQAQTTWEKLYGENHPDVAIALNNIGEAHRDLREIDEALECYTKALKIWRTFYGEIHPAVACVLNNMGSSFLARGSINEALNYYARALVIRQTLYKEANSDVAKSLINIGVALTVLGRDDEAIKNYTQALKTLRKIHGEEHPDVAMCLDNLGEALSTLGKVSEAIEYYQKALNVFIPLYGLKHPRVQAIKKSIASLQSKK